MTELKKTNWPLGVLRRLAGFREFFLIIIILAVVIGMSFASETFLTPRVLSSLLLSISFTCIIAIGMTVLLVSGGFDLSVGSTMALVGVVTAIIVKDHSLILAIPAGLAVGGMVGVANGLIVAKIGINPFITTLGMMGVVRGLAHVVAGGNDVTGLPKSFTVIGQGYLPHTEIRSEVTDEILFMGVQYPIVFALILVVLGDLALRKSRFLRQNYYLGGNEKAAVLSGINVVRMKIFNYGLTGVLAAVAGILLTARSGCGSVNDGLGVELKVIAAVIIGGASLQGGEGTVFGAFLGALLMSIIVTSLILLNVDTSMTQLVIGATLLIAVMIDTVGKRLRGMA